jgi:excisionase family DNA binding protein
MNQVPQGTVSVHEIVGYLNEDRYLGMAEAVAYLGLSERSLRKLLSQIPHFRVGSKLLFRKSEIDSWILRYRELGTEVDLGKIAGEALKGILGPRA